MEISNQVCSFEQSLKLLKLGIVNKSFFTWIECAEFDENGVKIIRWHPCLFVEKNLDMHCVWMPVDNEILCSEGDINQTRGNSCAFTVAELGAMLPDENVNGCAHTEESILCYVKHEGKGCYPVWRNVDGDEVIWQEDRFVSEAEIRAFILIELLEAKYITAEDCNTRLTNTPPLTDKS